jgi:hypothetical protein
MIYPYKDQVTLILKLCDHCKNHGFQIWVPKAGRDRTSTNRLRNTGALRTVADFRNKKWTHFLCMILFFFFFQDVLVPRNPATSETCTAPCFEGTSGASIAILA